MKADDITCLRGWVISEREKKPQLMRMIESRERKCLEDQNIFNLQEKRFSGKRSTEITQDMLKGDVQPQTLKFKKDERIKSE